MEHKYLICSCNAWILYCSDSGGMMKLWNVKNSECVKSLEVSDDDATVWALAISTNENYIITGASNSTLILWKVTIAAVQLT